MAEPFFHRRQHVSILPGLAIDDAVRMQADPRQSRGEQIAAMQAPDHRPRQARVDAGREQRRERSACAIRPLLSDFMHGAQGETDTGKRAIDCLDAERKRPPFGACRAEALDLAAKVGKSGGLWFGRLHRSPMNDAGAYPWQPPATHHRRSASRDRADLPQTPANDRDPFFPEPAACDHARQR
jgi:hypothetical protein